MAKEKLNWEDAQVRETYRHTASHIMAQAVKKLWPEAKLAIGPAIDNGFYYDFDCEHKFGEEDFAKIQKEMKRIVQANYPLERFELPREEAIKLIAQAGGMAVLAHPAKIKKIGERGSEEYWKNFEELLRSLKKMGLKGLECFYPEHTEEEQLKFAVLAGKFHLHMTEGSDYHGDE